MSPHLASHQIYRWVRGGRETSQEAVSGTNQEVMAGGRVMLRYEMSDFWVGLDKTRRGVKAAITIWVRATGRMNWHFTEIGRAAAEAVWG